MSLESFILAKLLVTDFTRFSAWTMSTSFSPASGDKPIQWQWRRAWLAVWAIIQSRVWTEPRILELSYWGCLYHSRRNLNRPSSRFLASVMWVRQALVLLQVWCYETDKSAVCGHDRPLCSSQQLEGPVPLDCRGAWVRYAQLHHHLH